MNKKGEHWNGNDAVTHAVRVLGGTTHGYNDNPPTYRNIDVISEEKLIVL